jgi:uncharacterized protein YerC
MKGIILRMVRLNKNQLTSKQFNDLFVQLNKTLSTLSAPETNLFLSDLLGTEEKIMLAKRLGIIVLLLEDYSLYKISRLLKVSPATAKKLKEELDNGKLKNLINVLNKNKRDYFTILNTIDSILHLGGILPHYNGPQRKTPK